MNTPPRAAVRRLALGRFVSFTGTLAAGTALTFTIYERTGSAAWISATMLLTWGLVGFLGPVAGAVGDRFDRRRVMIVSELAAASFWLAMMPFEDPAVLLALAFGASVLSVPYFPASSAAVPNVAGPENITWANSLLAVGANAGLTIGPIAGGLMIAVFDPAWMFLANAGTFAVSALLTASVHADFTDPTRTLAAEAEHRGVIAGARFLSRERVLRTVLLSWMAFIVGMATTIVADPVLADEFGTGSVGYGLIAVFWGGGTVVGAWFGRRVTPDLEGPWIVWFSAVVALTGFGVALSPWFWMVLVFMGLFGIADGPTQVVEQNLLQRRTPDAVRSRVMGAWEAAQHAALVVALVAGGWIVGAVGPKAAYAVGGVTGLVGTAILLPLLRWLPGTRRPAREVAAAAPDLAPSEPTAEARDPRLEPRFNPVVR